METDKVKNKSSIRKSSKQSRLLVVDDDPFLVALVARHLQVQGYEVETAGDGEDAITRMENNRFNLVVLDVMMPKMNGFEVCKNIREKYSSNELPVLMLSALSKPEDKKAGAEAGATDYLTKPVDRTRLLDTVKILLPFDVD